MQLISPLILTLLSCQLTVPCSHHTAQKHQSFLLDFADQCQSVVVRVGGVYSELTFFRSIGRPLSLADVKYIVHKYYVCMVDQF
jgi:hypothetical protein